MGLDSWVDLKCAVFPQEDKTRKPCCRKETALFFYERLSYFFGVSFVCLVNTNPVYTTAIFRTVWGYFIAHAHFRPKLLTCSVNPNFLYDGKISELSNIKADLVTFLTPPHFYFRPKIWYYKRVQRRIFPIKNGHSRYVEHHVRDNGLGIVCVMSNSHSRSFKGNNLGTRENHATLYRHSTLTTLTGSLSELLPIFRAEIQFFHTTPHFTWRWCWRSVFPCRPVVKLNWLIFV